MNPRIIHSSGAQTHELPNSYRWSLDMFELAGNQTDTACVSKRHRHASISEIGRETG